MWNFKSHVKNLDRVASETPTPPNWRNPDLTGFSLMMASLRLKRFKVHEPVHWPSDLSLYTWACAHRKKTKSWNFCRTQNLSSKGEKEGTKDTHPAPPELKKKMFEKTKRPNYENYAQFPKFQNFRFKSKNVSYFFKYRRSVCFTKKNRNRFVII